MMNQDFYDENEQQKLDELRRKKAEQFKLNFHEDDVVDNFDSENPKDNDAVLNSFSGQDVREKMARDSRQVLKEKKKEEKKALKAKNKRNRRIFRLTWIVSVIIIGAMAGVFLISGMNDMLAINRKDSSTVSVNIPKNPDINTVSQTLKKNGIITEASFFSAFAKVTKSADDFTQGTYKIKKNMDYEAIINYLLSSSNRTDTVSVMIAEGQNMLEIAATLKKAGVIENENKFLELCNSDEFDYEYPFIKSISNKSDRYYKLEGYLYPDTYEFYKNETPEDTIEKFLSNYNNRLTEKQDVAGYDKVTTIQDMVKKADTGYSLDEYMRIASIIQAEAANKDDMYYISSILHNRLSATSDMGVSSLGLDSTKFYPYRSEKDIPKDKKDGFKSKYNTYDFSGLPAGPICNPGMDAIIAAINPKDTDYYFFCHDDDGNAYYAATLYEQNANLESINNNE